MFTYHIEASTDNAGLCAAIKQAGMKAGVALKPGTPVDEALFALVDGGNVDMVLVCEPTAPAPPHRISNTPSLTPTSRFRTAVERPSHSPFRRHARHSAAPLVLPGPFSSPVTTLTLPNQLPNLASVSKLDPSLHSRARFAPGACARRARGPAWRPAAARAGGGAPAPPVTWLHTAASARAAPTISNSAAGVGWLPRARCGA
jgi:hypothetical protein